MLSTRKTVYGVRDDPGSDTGKYQQGCSQTAGNKGQKMQGDDDKTEVSPCDAAATFIRGALLLQEKWVLMIVHCLLAGSISFSELMRRGSVNTTTLTQRLNLLEQAGVLVKTIHSTMPPRTSYELTEAGLALGPILESIAEWSGKYLSHLEESPECSSDGCPGQEGSSLEC